MRKFFATMVLAAAVACIGSRAYAGIIISNSPNGSQLTLFGSPDTKTYGQAFTAPVTGTLDSFTLWLFGGVGALHGAVGNWNGTPEFGFGFGESSNLYTSAGVASAGPGPCTFTPNVSVIAGNQYVAYLSVYGESGANSTTGMERGTAAPYINYLVWNNLSDPKNNRNWNYFQDFGRFRFEAHFSAVPEPSTYAMAIAGLACGGFSVWRRRRRA